MFNHWGQGEEQEREGGGGWGVGVGTTFGSFVSVECLFQESAGGHRV